MLWMMLASALAGTPMVLPGGGMPAPFAATDAGGPWFALSPVGEGYRLAPVNVRLATETDPDGDWSYDYVEFEPAVPATLLLRGVDGAVAGPITTASPRTDLAPGTLTPVGGLTLLAAGGEQTWTGEIAWCPMPYQLVVESGGTRQTLFAGCSYGGAASVQWAGDLDGDGRVDLALWVPVDDGMALELWTGAAAAPGQLVGRVSRWVEEYGGC